LGAGRPGIGEAVTRRLVRDGFYVHGSFAKEYADNVDALSDLSTSITLTEVDHSDELSLMAFVDSAAEGDIDALVVAEFQFDMENPNSFDSQLWSRSLAVNLTAPTVAFHALKPRMADSSSAVIITSTEGFVGSFGASAYAATKA